MKRLVFISSLSLLFIASFCTNSEVFAQAFNVIPATEIDLQLNPENPVANEYVVATIESYGTDLNSATISWSVNNKVISSGKGLKKFSFTTGKLNTTTVLGLRVVTKEGEIVTKSVTFKGSSVDLIWESYGYTPPFYKGKTLFSHQNKTKFIALPHIIGSNGAEIPASNLIYKWTRNGTVLGDFSGYGKNTYTLIPSIISRPLEIQVEVTTPNTSDYAKTAVLASPVEPMIVFYEKSPLYGIQFQKSLSGEILMNGEKEINVFAEPFYFGANSREDSSLSYIWSVGNSQIDNDNSQPNRIFRQKEGTFGVSNISVSIENSVKVLQSASNSFNLNFNNTTSQNTF